jgi:carboxyl-terminal processing protease
MKGKFNNLLIGLGIGTLLSLIFFAGFFAGSTVQQRQYNNLGANDPNVRDFLTAYHLVTQRSYFKPFDKHHLVYAAIDGMLSATGDPHTLFLSPPQNQQADSQLNGAQFSGIGAIVQSVCRGLDIVTPLPGGPALKAGLRRGDVVTSINGKAVASMSQDQAISKVHGRTGTHVRLTVVRGKEHPFSLTVTRGTIAPITAYGYTLGHGIGYLQITSFGDTTSTEVQNAITTLSRDHLRAIVIDLRNNPGGFVDAAQSIVSQFVTKGTVAYEQTADKKLHPLSVIPMPQAPHVPIAVLVDGGTASAAEITAAALRDHGKAVLFGTRTYGKGSMQSVYSMSDGSSIRITDRLWLTPSKHSIGQVGIRPDHVVQPVAHTGCATAQSDSQLNAAVQYLLSHTHA